jgi:hypothetical protein
MQPFAFVSPASVSDAVAAAASNQQARFVAGGTKLLDLMKLEVETPPQLLTGLNFGLLAGGSIYELCSCRSESGANFRRLREECGQAARFLFAI